MISYYITLYFVTVFIIYLIIDYYVNVKYYYIINLSKFRCIIILNYNTMQYNPTLYYHIIIYNV